MVQQTLRYSLMRQNKKQVKNEEALKHITIQTFKKKQSTMV